MIDTTHIIVYDTIKKAAMDTLFLKTQNTTDSTSLIISISTIVGLVISGIIAFIIAYITTKYATKQSYKNEYHKKILDKRIEIYEKIESLLVDLKQFFEPENIENAPKYIHYSGHRAFISQLITIIIEYRTWISRETYIKLLKLNLILGEISDERITDETLITINERPTIELINELFVSIQNDWDNLYDIETFQNDKRKHYPYY